jgi:hypothetical protein
MLTTVLRPGKDRVRQRQWHRARYLLCQLNGVGPCRCLIALFKSLRRAQTAEDDAALLPWQFKDI